ncbi:hypothetical protein JN11_03922 [Mucilaginibacter frigoritolerans]|uniref:Uncharacterized protein n=1 Tax=Mucilaginibacter frigoritolerans TaxID=652788 RepID=A0A562TT62_9SPHI|nr:hypothetical protein [Mucilaginibacter frigoritolerans]TWI96809.1 hypothetical protein JN11_03922 [Mucilaginibacter frigoritolerans]
MEKVKITSIDNKVINALIEYPDILNKIINTQTIWYPEWRHFKIIRINEEFLLFEKNRMVFRSSSYDVVKNSLIERFHFYELEQKTPIATDYQIGNRK